MQLIYGILALVAVASALPSSASEDPSRPLEIGTDGALRAAAQCSVGTHYCFSAIIDDLSTFFHSS